ncbi:PREDICTED: uncharacterized protein LOC107068642 [Polistes dominula]|uniref:Uncharacterized protein LOC107068642 n=1 Tax=Polistes dominula TaxID=743375 RepID=A0ABM1IKN1_POLDO|nr:PREDICTED: uncharacterized protein LOC107068642 [Polistes dominula]
MKMNAELVEKLEKNHIEYESLLISIANLKKANDNLRNNYEARENVIKMLRENNQQLEEENTELKLLRSVDTHTSIDRLSHSDEESYCTIHDSPYTIFNDSNHQDSLYDELKASGFANICSWNDTISRELKKEVQWYELEIHKLIQQTESIFQQTLVLTRNEKCVNVKHNVIESSEKLNNLEILRQRIQILLDTVNAKPPEAGLETDIQIQTQNSRSRINVCDLSTFNSNEDHVEYFSKKDQIITSYDNISNEKQEPKVIMVPETSTVNPIIQTFHQNVRPVTNSHPSPTKKSIKNVSLISLEKRTIPYTSTKCQDTTNDASKIKYDTFCHSNGNSTKENEELQFMDHLSLPINFPTTFQPVTIKCNRKSKSESNLLPTKKTLSSRSLNVIIPLSGTEKMNETIEIRKSFDNSTCEETKTENKFQREFKEKNVENVTNSYEYKFGGTYRSLNDSSDSSVSSSSLRSENLLFEDFSLDGLEQCLYELERPVLMAPMKLKLPLNKVTSLSKEPYLTEGNFNAASNNTLIDNTKSECNHEPKQDEMTTNFEEGSLIKRNCNIVSPDNYLNNIDKEIYSINGETYLIDKSTPNRYYRTSMNFSNFSNIDQENNTEIHVPAAYSTPMRIDSKDKSKVHRCDIHFYNYYRQFANLKMSKTKIPIFRIYEDPLKKMRIGNEWIKNVDTENKNNKLSISLSNLENVVYTKRKENNSEYSVTKVAQKNNTEKGINIANKSEKEIVSTSLDGENQTYDSKENFHKLQDCKFDRFNLTKLNIQNDEVIVKETELR